MVPATGSGVDTNPTEHGPERGSALQSLFARKVVPGSVRPSSSYETKKNSLFLRIGPPRRRPIWLKSKVPGLKTRPPTLVPTMLWSRML